MSTTEYHLSDTGKTRPDHLVLPLYRLWEQCDRVTLCRDTYEQAVSGICPTHGGDGCLYAYVQVSELHRIQAAWLQEQTR